MVRLLDYYSHDNHMVHGRASVDTVPRGHGSRTPIVIGHVERFHFGSPFRHPLTCLSGKNSLKGDGEGTRQKREKNTVFLCGTGIRKVSVTSYKRFRLSNLIKLRVSLDPPVCLDLNPNFLENLIIVSFRYSSFFFLFLCS